MRHKIPSLFSTLYSSANCIDIVHYKSISNFGLTDRSFDLMLVFYVGFMFVSIIHAFSASAINSIGFLTTTSTSA